MILFTVDNEIYNAFAIWRWGMFFLKGSSDAHFTQVDMILYARDKKSITYFG